MSKLTRETLRQMISEEIARATKAEPKPVQVTPEQLRSIIMQEVSRLDEAETDTAQSLADAALAATDDASADLDALRKRAHDLLVAAGDKHNAPLILGDRFKKGTRQNQIYNILQTVFAGGGEAKKSRRRATLPTLKLLKDKLGTGLDLNI